MSLSQQWQEEEVGWRNPRSKQWSSSTWETKEEGNATRQIQEEQGQARQVWKEAVNSAALRGHCVHYDLTNMERFTERTLLYWKGRTEMSGTWLAQSSDEQITLTPEAAHQPTSAWAAASWRLERRYCLWPAGKAATWFHGWDQRWRLPADTPETSPCRRLLYHPSVMWQRIHEMFDSPSKIVFRHQRQTMFKCNKAPR